MSDSLFSAIQAYNWKPEAAPAPGMNPSGSDRSTVHFDDFLSRVNPRHDQEAARLAPIAQEEQESHTLTGSPERVAALTDDQHTSTRATEHVAALTAGHNVRQINDTDSSTGAVPQLYAPTKSTPGTSHEGWTFLAPTVTPPKERIVATASAEYQIYTKSSDETAEGPLLRDRSSRVDIRR
ncbi:MAG: hypothetical protein H7839_04565 [Magnetococcus sp. YQC-5]